MHARQEAVEIINAGPDDGGREETMIRDLRIGTLGLTLAFVAAASGQPPQQRDVATEPFKGVTADGSVLTGLFPVRATGVSTRPVRLAADRFLASLTPLDMSLHDDVAQA